MGVMIGRALRLAFAVTFIASGGTAAAPPPRMTVIGDSVLTQVLWNQEPRTLLASGLDVHLEIGICRRLTKPSCPWQEEDVPSLVEVVGELGPELGSTVLVEMGYNEPPAEFPAAVDTSIRVLQAAGVTKILWANMHEWQPQYQRMNRMLASAAQRYPSVTVVDWASFSRLRYSWFQGDGVHLTYDGAMAMATLFHAALESSRAPPLVLTSRKLPSGTVGKRYTARLRAVGGTAPYRWSLLGPPPRGIHLLARGVLLGTPTQVTRRVFTARVTDRWGVTATHRLAISVKAE